MYFLSNIFSRTLAINSFFTKIHMETEYHMLEKEHSIWCFQKIGGKPPKNPMNKWMIWGVKTTPIFSKHPMYLGQHSHAGYHFLGGGPGTCNLRTKIYTNNLPQPPSWEGVLVTSLPGGF